MESGLIDPLGSIDSDLGGSTSRYALSAELTTGDWRAVLYAVDYELSLWSNFTYLLDDPVLGDEFEQVDQRRIYGARVDGHRHFGAQSRPLTLRRGAELRRDDIDRVGPFGTVARQRNGVTRNDTVSKSSAAAWADAEFAMSDTVRASLGLRADHYRFDVDARIPENSGDGSDSLLSRRLNVAWRVSEIAEPYANRGRGFHSNDVRGPTIATDPATGEAADPVEVLVPSDGAELGARFESGGPLIATVTAFWLELDSELVYVGDAGTTVPNDATERRGIEAAAFSQVTDSLAANLEYTYVDAEFLTGRGGGRELPGAVDSTVSLALNAAWRNDFFAGVRLRCLGEAPLIEDGPVRSEDPLLLNASVGYRLGRTGIRLDGFNLLDSGADDIAYYYASRLPGEPAGGIDDMYFHPLEPRALRPSVAWRRQ